MKGNLILYSSFLVIFISCPFCKKYPENNKIPSLLIIHTDEHNFRTLGCYRASLPPDQAFVWGERNIVETPQIDWLAENGAMCTSFYATTPCCSPSRASFLSGRYPQNTSVVSNNDRLDDDIITFARVLQENGYKTGYAGKWHLDGSGKPQWAPVRNFGFEDNKYMYNRGHYKKVEDTPQGPRIVPRNKDGVATYDVDNADEKSFMTDFLTDKTIDFIKKNKDAPFCYMVSYPDPHGPNTVRSPYDTMYNHLDFTVPATAFKDTTGILGWSQKKKNFIKKSGMSKYFGMVKCIDDNVGRIIDALKYEGILDNTIVVFTSDHGDLLGEHARDDKFVTYEGSAKIPFILYYPVKVIKGKIINEALSCVDFQPTILNLMGVDLAGNEDGRDASVLFISENQSKNWKDIVFLRGSGFDRINAPSSWIAAITDRYKLVLSEQEGYVPWLYDLEKDPDELINYYFDPDYIEIVRGLASELHDYCLNYYEPRFDNPYIKNEIMRIAERL
ncbi:N-acetylglucosamine-6-O-sulfatase [subsurface metagenome]